MVLGTPENPQSLAATSRETMSALITELLNGQNKTGDHYLDNCIKRYQDAVDREMDEYKRVEAADFLLSAASAFQSTQSTKQE